MRDNAAHTAQLRVLGGVKLRRICAFALQLVQRYSAAHLPYVTGERCSVKDSAEIRKFSRSQTSSHCLCGGAAEVHVPQVLVYASGARQYVAIAQLVDGCESARCSVTDTRL
jgi:hypothetical protein